MDALSEAAGDGARKAALMLSGLREEDRAWMLARLDDGGRARLSPLLAELRSLGMALDLPTARQLAQAAPAAQAASTAPASDSGEPANRTLAAASARAVFDALAGEPDWLLAIVLRARPWKWRTEFQQLLGTERRLRLQRARAVEVRPRVIEVLLCALEKRLDEEMGERAHEPEPAARRRVLDDAARGLWRKVRAWRR